MRHRRPNRPVGFIYIAVLATVMVLVVLVYALDYQSRSSQAVSRMAEARLYSDIAASEHVGETLTSASLQSRSGVDWLSADIPISMDSEQNTNEKSWDDVEAIESWTPGAFPTLGSFPEEGQTAETLGQTIASPATEDDGAIAFPGQTRGFLEPEANDVGFRAPKSRYRLSLVEAFPFAAYAPEGKVTITGTGVSWANPTEAELDKDNRTMDFYSGFPFRVGAKSDILVDELPYGEAYTLEGPSQIKGGGIAFQGYLPYTGENDGYAAKLKEQLTESIISALSTNSYDKTDVVFGTLNVTNIVEAIFTGESSFNNFLTYEQSTRWWYFLIPGFKSRGPALDITLHAPIKPDGGVNDPVNDDPVEGDPDMEMTPELQEATDKLQEIEAKLEAALLSPKLGGDPTGTQPLSKGEGDKKAGDFERFTNIINSFNEAKDLEKRAKDERKKKTGRKEDKAADARHEAKAKDYEKQARDEIKQHKFDSLDEIKDWMGRTRSYTREAIGFLPSVPVRQTYKTLLKDWEDAQEDLARAKDKVQGIDDSEEDEDGYDPGPNREREKELSKKPNPKLDRTGWKGTNLWTMVVKIAKVIANLVKDIGTAFYNHVFVIVKIFGVKIPIPNPVKIVTFFFADGEFKDQTVQGQNFSFKPANGTPDLADLVLKTLQSALVQEVTMVYLGKDGGVGPSIPIRIGSGSAQNHQVGEPEIEIGTFSIHNTFTVPAGRTFKLREKDGMSGMTIAADLWLQRGSTMVIDGDLTMVNPVEDNTKPHHPKGKIVMEPGSTLVVDGDLTAAGDVFMGSILVTRRAGRVEPITSAIICTGDVDLPHGIRNGFNLMHLAELVDNDAATHLQNLFDDVVPNVSKVLGPFHSRKPHFARNGATFTFYFPVIVPNPISSMLTKNLNVKIFAALSPLFSGSLNMTLGENFPTATDWWMFGEDRIPALPKVLPGPIEAAFGEATEQGEFIFGSGKAALENMVDEDFFVGRARTIVEDEMGTMLGKIDNLANNIDDFVENVAEETLVEFFTPENITTQLIKILGGAAAAALDPTGLAAEALDKILNEFIPEQFREGDTFLSLMIEKTKDELTVYGIPVDGADYLKSMADDVLEPFTSMAETLRGQATVAASRVAMTVMAAETPGILCYGDTITVDGLYAAGLFVANSDIEMNCAYTIGSMVSVEGDITAKEVLYVPEFTRAAIYQPPQVVTTPSKSGVAALPEYWTDSLGLDFGDGSFGAALNYGNGTGDGRWHQVPGFDNNTAFRVSGGWGQ